MMSENLSDDELRQALLDRGHDKAAAALDESVRQRASSRERLHADLLAEGYETAAAALSPDERTTDERAPEKPTDMNALIRRAAGREVIA
jgi:hypothetical protein